MEEGSRDYCVVADDIIHLAKDSLTITKDDMAVAYKLLTEFSYHKEKTLIIQRIFSHIVSDLWSSFAFIKLNRLKFLGFLHPDMADMANAFYGNFSVFDHTMSVLNQTEKFNTCHELKYAALFHDIGKPMCAKYDGGRWTFYGHEMIGSETAIRFLRNNPYANVDVNVVASIIKGHMIPYTLASASNNAILNFKKKFPNAWREIIIFAICDKIATCKTLDKCDGLIHVLDRANSINIQEEYGETSL